MLGSSSQNELTTAFKRHQVCMSVIFNSVYTFIKYVTFFDGVQPLNALSS